MPWSYLAVSSVCTWRHDSAVMCDKFCLIPVKHQMFNTVVGCVFEVKCAYFCLCSGHWTEIQGARSIFAEHRVQYSAIGGPWEWAEQTGAQHAWQLFGQLLELGRWLPQLLGWLDYSGGQRRKCVVTYFPCTWEVDCFEWMNGKSGVSAWLTLAPWPPFPQYLHLCTLWYASSPLQ